VRSRRWLRTMGGPGAAGPGQQVGPAAINRKRHADCLLAVGEVEYNDEVLGGAVVQFRPTVVDDDLGWDVDTGANLIEPGLPVVLVVWVHVGRSQAWVIAPHPGHRRVEVVERGADGVGGHLPLQGPRVDASTCPFVVLDDEVVLPNSSPFRTIGVAVDMNRAITNGWVLNQWPTAPWLARAPACQATWEWSWLSK
jgi:hypothetical protein